MKGCLFIVLVAVTLSSSNVKAECVETSSLITDSGEACFSQLHFDEQAEYSTNPDSEMPAVKCLFKCVLEKVGDFQNGTFVLDNMTKRINEEVEDKHLAERIISRYTASAEAASGLEDDCDKVRRFVILNRTAELKERLLSLVYCP